jgi:nitroreductase
MITAAKTTTNSGRPHRLAPYDLGLAAQNLTVQATALGLVVHQMGGFDSAKARAAFSIPEGFEPMTAIAVGYVGDPETLPEKNRNQELAPRTRKPLNEFVFGDTWDTPNPLVVASPNPPTN